MVGQERRAEAMDSTPIRAIKAKGVSAVEEVGFVRRKLPQRAGGGRKGGKLGPLTRGAMGSEKISALAKSGVGSLLFQSQGEEVTVTCCGGFIRSVLCCRRHSKKVLRYAHCVKWHYCQQEKPWPQS